MLTTEEEFMQELAALTREQEETVANLIRVRDLLDRADQRKKNNPSEARSWNKKLDNLEESLLSEKSRLARCEQNIRYTRRKLEEFKTKPEAPVPGTPGDDTTFEEATHEALAHQEKDAVDASLEEAALRRPWKPKKRTAPKTISRVRWPGVSIITKAESRPLRRQSLSRAFAASSTSCVTSSKNATPSKSAPSL